jgi:transposase
MSTGSKWAARVAGWRASGLSAAEFCAGKDFTAGGLRHWSSRLGREIAGGEVRLAKVVAGPAAETETPIVLEVAGTRIAVRRGFDRQTLRDVLAALEGWST